MTDRPTALDLPPVDPLPDKTQTYFDLCAEKIGFVPNVLRAYAFDIDKLDAFTTMYNELMLGPGGLTKLDREMIAVVVSATNRCHYCLVAHGAAVRALSADPALGEALVTNWRVAKLGAREVAMLEFAEAITLHSHRTREADRDALRAHGFSERDIWDIAAVAGFFNMSNRMASALGMVPNPEYHAQAR